jgi:hypothetical protein
LVKGEIYTFSAGENASERVINSGISPGFIRVLIRSAPRFQFSISPTGFRKTTVLIGRLEIIIFAEVVHQDDDFAHSGGKGGSCRLNSLQKLPRILPVKTTALFNP